MKKAIILIICILSLVCQAKTWTIDGLPNVQRDDRTKMLVNPDHIISRAAASKVDTIVAVTRRATTVEIVPVVVDNIKSDDPDEFATKLFRRWGIGKKDNNNGILILVVLEQRKVVIRTGYGAEKVLPDLIAGRIASDIMIPYFKEEDYDRGLISGVLAVCRQIADPEAAQEMFSTQKEFGGNWFSRQKEHIEREGRHQNRFKEFDFFRVYTMIGCIVAGLMMLVLGSLLISLRKKSDHQKYRTLKPFAFPFWVISILFIFIPLPAPLFIYYLLHKWRDHPRNCPDCGAAMEKLDEEEDNKHLTSSQDHEESIKSVDYDVWLCHDCGKTLVYDFVMDSDYKECPKCHARTFKLTESRITTEPTSERSGKGEKVFTCTSCNYHKIRPFYVSRKYNDKRIFSGILCYQSSNVPQN